MQIDNKPSNQRLARNTLLLYFRMLLLLLISLVTTRIVLKGLGVFDYGLYNVVAGFVVMLSFMTGALGNATQRYLAFELPKGNIRSLGIIFNQIQILHFIIAIFVFVLAETIGLWFLNNYINIEQNRYVAANWVYQFSIVSTLLSILCIPYNALLIAHENMKIFAYMGLLEGGTKLIVCAIFLLNDIDYLIYYSLLLAISAIIIRVIYTIYCHRIYLETREKIIVNRNILKEIGRFSMWSLFGTVSTMAVSHGVNILVNMFFNSAVNAARGVSYQIENAVKSFIMNFQTAMNPQIVKSYSMGDYDTMQSLIAFGSKISFFIMYILSLPIIINISYILHLWLGNVPKYTIEFTSLALINTLFATFSGALSISVQATGNIKKYQIVMGTLLFLNFPVTYILFKLGYPPYYSVISSTIIEIICFGERLSLSKQLYNLNVLKYIYRVFPSVLYCILCTLPLVILIKLYFCEETLWYVLLNILLSFIVCSVSILFLGFTHQQRDTIFLYIHKLYEKISK